ncbi:O-antigen ligase family protein [Glaciecola sp. 2405UD65-10]|uniref:O-antigen ligase family protein n=1 Tax=Glaciecola sp. 2405UD65-10 TaxID=3397244 RepID=UPI003B597578
MKIQYAANNSNLFLFYVSFSLFGYCVIAPLAELISPNSETSLVTILYRVFVLGGAMLFIFQLFFLLKKMYVETLGMCALLLVLLFWFIYTCRLFYDATFQANLLGEDTIISYITVGYGFVFIPMLAVARSYNEADLKRLFIMSLYILLLGVLLNLSVSAFQILSGSWQGGQRLSTERLNPISLGRYSAVLFLLAFGLIQIYNKKKILLIIVMFIGLIGVLLSGSRGALVSLLSVLIIILLANVSLKKIMLFSILLPLCVGIGIFLMSVLVPDIDVISNYLAMGGKSDQSAQIRYQLYHGALEQFYNKPILGDLIVEREYKFYPHNQVLEILMATGVTGMLVFVSLNLFVLGKLNMLKNCTISKRGGVYGILTYCLIFYVLGGMFSGTIFGALEYWYFVIIICFSTTKYGSVSIHRRIF